MLALTVEVHFGTLASAGLVGIRFKVGASVYDILNQPSDLSGCMVVIPQRFLGQKHCSLLQ